MPKLGETTVPLKKLLVCRGCGASWKPNPSIPRRFTKCPYCGKAKDPRDRSAYTKAYFASSERLQRLKQWSKSRRNRKAKGSKDRSLLKKRLFFAISGTINAKCVRCGCDDWRLLEVNHKNGGGRKELGIHSHAFQWAVVMGRRKTDDLEILCRPCNAIHYLERKFGPLPMRVLWGAEGR